MNKFKLTTIAFLFMANYSFAQDDEIKGTDLLDQVRTNLISLSAQFEQYEVNNGNDPSEKSSGKVWLKAPNQFKWEYSTPGPQLIIADGSQVWIYDEDLEQVTIKQQNNDQNPIYILLNKENLEEHYIVGDVFTIEFTDSHDPNRTKDDTQWVELIPKVESNEVKSVRIGIRNNLLKQIIIHNQMDNSVVFEFDKIKKNPKLKDDFFSFVAPKGTDIIQDTVIDVDEGDSD